MEIAMGIQTIAFRIAYNHQVMFPVTGIATIQTPVSILGQLKYAMTAWTTTVMGLWTAMTSIVPATTHSAKPVDVQIQPSGGIHL